MLIDLLCCRLYHIMPGVKATIPLNRLAKATSSSHFGIQPSCSTALLLSISSCAVSGIPGDAAAFHLAFGPQSGSSCSMPPADWCCWLRPLGDPQAALRRACATRAADLLETLAPRREEAIGRPIPAADDVAGAHGHDRALRMLAHRLAVPISADREFGARLAQGVGLSPAKRIGLV
jgi:hypothetical protein